MPAKPGANIRVISPSGTLMDGGEALALSKRGEQMLLSLGLRVSWGEHARGTDGWKAGTVTERLGDLRAAFEDADVAAVMTTQGGENSNDLLAQMDWDFFRAHPKFFFGSSDITVLLNAMYARSGLVGCYGVDVCWGLGKNATQVTLDRLKSVLFTGRSPAVKHPVYPTWECIQPGRGEGVCLGGCLPSFNLLLGTPYDPLRLTQEPFVFIIESIGQSLACIESEVVQLTQQPGFQERCRGVVTGHFFQCGEDVQDPDRLMAQTIGKVVQELHIPVVSLRDLGHATENILFPMGGRVAVSAQPAQCSIEILHVF